MLAIKLQRVGKKKQSSFRIVVAEKRSKLTKVVEDLGFFNPHTDKFEVNKERTLYWLKIGAKPTDTVFNLLVKAAILKGPKKPVHKKAKKQEIMKQKPEKQAVEQESAALDKTAETK